VPRVRVAIVGSGISGLAAAHVLQRTHDVTVFEAAPRPGGHVYTVNGADGVRVDMGFIVCNRERYPHFCALLDELGIETRPTTMSFAVSVAGAPDQRDNDHFEWGSESLRTMFATRRPVRMLVEIMRFLRAAKRDLGSELVARASLDEYLAARKVSREVRERFVVPLAAALWSLPPSLCGSFPAATYLRFLDQHGMLSAFRPMRWHTILGGSQRYVDALLSRAQFDVRVATPVHSIVRNATAHDAGVTIDDERFDRVIIATHANTALALLANPTPDERRVLGAFRYSTNRTVLHRDRSFLPRHVHAAWNYVADAGGVSVTYSMTRLQGLDGDYFVTLNPRREPNNKLHEVTFEHPQFDRAALAAQAELPRLSGTLHTYYAGAHFGFGFHEDGMRAGLAAAARLMADDSVTQDIALAS
jgi:predicted NAD/FAD-binding protein